jgi:uncharacterized protein YegP (UPF0339 family)
MSAGRFAETSTKTLSIYRIGRPMHLHGNLTFRNHSLLKYKAMGKFLVKTGNDGQFYFSLVASNGQPILGSEGYTSKAACDNGIESVRKNASDDGRYERKNAADGRFFFTLKASNGQVIGKSQLYTNAAGCENGIESVKTNAPEAPVEME